MYWLSQWSQFTVHAAAVPVMTNIDGRVLLTVTHQHPHATDQGNSADTKVQPGQVCQCTSDGGRLSTPCHAHHQIVCSKTLNITTSHRYKALGAQGWSHILINSLTYIYSVRCAHMKTNAYRQHACTDHRATWCVSLSRIMTIRRRRTSNTCQAYCRGL